MIKGYFNKYESIREVLGDDFVVKLETAYDRDEGSPKKDPIEWLLLHLVLVHMSETRRVVKECIKETDRARQECQAVSDAFQKLVTMITVSDNDRKH